MTLPTITDYLASHRAPVPHGVLVAAGIACCTMAVLFVPAAMIMGG